MERAVGTLGQPGRASLLLARHQEDQDVSSGPGEPEAAPGMRFGCEGPARALWRASAPAQAEVEEAA